MKKVELHLDAAVAITLVFVVAIGFIIFQWQRHSAIAQANVDLQLKVVILELQQARLETIVKKCAPEKL